MYKTPPKTHYTTRRADRIDHHHFSSTTRGSRARTQSGMFSPRTPTHPPPTHQLTLQKSNHMHTTSQTKRSETNVHESATLLIQMQTRTHNHNYQRLRCRSTATFVERCGTVRHFSHPMPPYSRTSTDTADRLFQKSTSPASQKHLAPLDTPTPPAYPTPPSSFGLTGPLDGRRM